MKLSPSLIWLHQTFDHTLLVAQDDPDAPEFLRLRDKGLADIRILPVVSCEHIAAWVGEQMEPGVRERTQGRCWIASVEVFEHGANSAIWRNPEDVLRGVKAEALGRLVAD